MQILDISWRNIIRNRRRSIISMVAIGFAIGAATFGQDFFSGAVNDTVYNYKILQFGNIRVMDKDYWREYDRQPLDRPIYTVSELDAFLSAQKEVEAVLPRIPLKMMLGYGDKTTAAQILAIEPERERATLHLDKDIVSNTAAYAGGHYLTASNEALIGIRLAEKTGLRIGDKINVISGGQNMYGKTFVIAGIYESSMSYINNDYVIIPIAGAQEMLKFDNDTVTELLALLKSPNQAPQLAQRWARDYKKLNPAGAFLYFRPWQSEMIVTMLQKTALTMYYIIWLIIMLLACSTIVNLMMMMVFERIREIGMMRALGMSDGNVKRMLLAEAGFMGGIGGGIGALIGYLLAVYMSVHGVTLNKNFEGIDFPINAVFYAEGSILYPIVMFCLGMSLTLLTTLLPVAEAVKKTPSESIRTLN